MRFPILPFLVLCLCVFLVATAQGRVSHGESAVFSLDVVTAVHGTDHSPELIAPLTAYPNPFNPHTVIEFELGGNAVYELAIYDARGRVVREFAPATAPSGRQQIRWDGDDDAGRAVPTGLYFCRLKTIRGAHVVTMTLVR